MEIPDEMIVILDTAPIISLLKAGQLELLQKLYNKVLIAQAVYRELIEKQKADLLLMDEQKGRKAAKRLNVRHFCS